MFRPPHTTFIALCLVFATTAAQARVIDQGAQGFLIENTVTVPVDAPSAWQALVQDVSRWWPADHTWFGHSENLRIDPRAGGCFCEIDGSREAAHMQIAFVDPPQRLRMLGGLGPMQGMGLYGALDWIFDAQDADLTRITLRYQVGGYTPSPLGEFVKVVDQVQAQQLQALADHLSSAQR